ncbi:MAG: HAD family hydrolase, partial [Ruminococcaceae bacterium]|nr:HAD family hydrolase [Oscillospiraceae bacterium]
GSRIAIVTGKDRDRTEELLGYHGIRQYFDCLICGDDAVRPKPSPEPVRAALAALGCRAAEAVMIGDGYNDILSAKAAGVRSVLTRWYGHEAVPDEADHTVETAEELRKLLERL